MKSKRFFTVCCGLAIVALLLLTTCSADEVPVANLPSTDGKLTFTGVTKANGKYAYINHSLETGVLLVGLADTSSTGKFKGAQIKDGKVNIPLYMYIGSTKTLKAYTATDTVTNLKIFVSSLREQAQSDISTLKYAGFYSISFIDGIATVTLDDPYTVDCLD
jgi:hypothetical protein